MCARRSTQTRQLRRSSWAIRWGAALSQNSFLGPLFCCDRAEHFLAVQSPSSLNSPPHCRSGLVATHLVLQDQSSWEAGGLVLSSAALDIEWNPILRIQARASTVNETAGCARSVRVALSLTLR